jgi:hypothetical protein
MAAVPSRLVPLLLLGLGFLLLLNPIYAFPEGVATSYQYGIDEIGDSEHDSHFAMRDAENVLVCPGVRTCFGETMIAEEGSVVVEHGAIFEYQRGYDVVSIDGEYYEPTAEALGDSDYRLGHEELTTEDALATAALPSEEAGSDVRRALRWGVVSSNDPVPAFEEHRIIEHDGSYYQRSSYRWSGSGSVPNYHALVARFVGFGLGTMLLVVGYRQYQRLLRLSAVSATAGSE